MNTPKFIRFWFPVCIYSGIIFYVSSLQGDDIPVGVGNIDKLVHVVEYIPFGFLLCRGLFKNFAHMRMSRLFFFVFLGSFIYGISDEYHQSFVAGRAAEGMDALADSLGGGLGGFLYILKNKRERS